MYTPRLIGLDYFVRPRDLRTTWIDGWEYSSIPLSPDSLTLAELEDRKNQALLELKTYFLELDNNSCVIAGGVLASITFGAWSDDVDYFCISSEKERKEFRQSIAREHPSLSVLVHKRSDYRSQPAILGTYRVQGQLLCGSFAGEKKIPGYRVRDVNINIIFIDNTMFSSVPEYIEKTFDFTCCKLYASNTEALNQAHPAAMIEASMGKLSISNLTEVDDGQLLSRLARISKYKKKGLRMDAPLRARLEFMRRKNPALSNQLTQLLA